MNPFGTSWIILAGFVAMLGHFSALMALATHFFGVRQGYRQLRPSLRRVNKMLTLENALGVGLSLIFISMIGLATIGINWSSSGFLALPSVLSLTFFAVLGALGLQTGLGGFLLAIIAGHDANLAPATQPDPQKRDDDPS